MPRNDPVTLNCKAEGRPPPEILWFKDGKVGNFSSSPHRVTLPEGALFFLTVQQNNKENDAGVYWCVARNKAGQARSHNATLKVAGEFGGERLEKEMILFFFSLYSRIKRNSQHCVVF